MRHRFGRNHHGVTIITGQGQLVAEERITDGPLGLRLTLAVYDEMRSPSPEPDVVPDVPTEFGTVRAYQHGPAGGDPIVLVHCLYASSPMWADHVRALVGDFTVYPVDMLGQPGASRQLKAMRTTGDCVRCIDNILDGLNVHGVHLAVGRMRSCSWSVSAQLNSQHWVPRTRGTTGIRNCGQ